jgi:hypothetical protein
MYTICQLQNLLVIDFNLFVNFLLNDSKSHVDLFVKVAHLQNLPKGGLKSKFEGFKNLTYAKNLQKKKICKQ